MFSLVMTLYVVTFLTLGVRKPFLWVLAYLYIDIVAPQKVVWALLPHMQISLVAFIAACAGWVFVDRKHNSRFTLRQGIMLLLLCYCGMTTMSADFPVEAAEKWGWVWKAMVFAMFLPLTLNTRLRIEAVVLIMALGIGAIVISGGLKTLAGGGGYGSLKLLVDDNTGLYEGSIISCIAIAAIPLIGWLARFSSIFPSDWRVKLFALGLCFACALMPIGTQARTGLLCLAVLMLMALRSIKRRFLYIGLMGAVGMIALPFLPASYTKRMSTIESHSSDSSAGTRIAVWKWTLEYVEDHPFGGGFDAFRGNVLQYETEQAETSGSITKVEVKTVQDKARAYHSSYFEMLGEQGYPGFVIWAWLHLSGLWQMERIRMRWRKRTAPGETWQAPLAEALQQAQVVYLVGSFFVGIAFQPFVLMLIGLQCGLWSYLRRVDSPRLAPIGQRNKTRAAQAVTAG